MIKDDSLKKILQLLFAGLLIISGFTRCKVVDKFTQFDLKYETHVTVPASAGINLPFNVFVLL